MTTENIHIFGLFPHQFPPAAEPTIDPTPAEIYPNYDISLVNKNFLVIQPYEELFAGTFKINDRAVTADQP